MLVEIGNKCFVNVDNICYIEALEGLRWIIFFTTELAVTVGQEDMKILMDALSDNKKVWLLHDDR